MLNATIAGYAGNTPKDVKGTAVDSVNASLESLTGRLNMLAGFAGRVSDGILGVALEAANGASGGPRPVSQSTQDHIRDLEAAFERLSGQINRLG